MWTSRTSKALIAAAVLAAPMVAMLPTTAQAQASVSVRIGAPPPPRAEVIPGPRRGYVWAPGHWEWRHHRHEWVGGYWVRERPGYAYAPPAWNEVNGQWVYAPGRWDRRHDRDGDGVPNRHDHRPNDPYRR